MQSFFALQDHFWNDYVDFVDWPYQFVQGKYAFFSYVKHRFDENNFTDLLLPVLFRNLWYYYYRILG